ncbi:unnamed protein product [Rotaria sp. Silwood1]|nr:unnamed protein product [Rotaria sp. Silwood1]
MIFFIDTVFSISCYKCLSINGSNPSCEDTFQGDVTGKSSFLYAPCLTNLRGRKGLFPATHSSIPVQYMYRTCARDEADDNEITRASHCGLLKLDWIDKSQRLRGCLHICDKDACNQASYFNYSIWRIIYSFSILFIISLERFI